MKKLLAISFCLLALAGCKTATLYDQYGPVMSSENGSFKDLIARGKYSVTYATPQDVTNTNTALARTGIPLKQISSITVEQEVESSSQGGTILSALGEACIGAVKIAAGVCP